MSSCLFVQVTVICIYEGLKKLRQANQREENSMMPVELWRGIKDTEIPDAFLCKGGAEPVSSRRG